MRCTSRADGSLLEYEGVLSMEVSGAGRDRLWELRGALSSAIESHFELRQVRIVSVASHHGGAPARRLEDSSFFLVRFASIGGQPPSTDGQGAGLKPALQAAFAAASASEVQVQSASVEWTAAYPEDARDAESAPQRAPQDEADEASSLLVPVAVAVAVLAALAVCMFALACRRRAQRVQNGEPTLGGNEKESESVVHDVDAWMEEGKKATHDGAGNKAAWEVASISTDGSGSQNASNCPSSESGSPTDAVPAAEEIIVEEI